MKKTLIALLLAATAFTMTGCSSKSKQEIISLNNEIAELNEKNAGLLKEIDDLRQTIDDNKQKELYGSVHFDYSGPMRYTTPKDAIDSFVEKFSKEGKNIILKTSYADKFSEDSKLLAITTTETITNVDRISIDSHKYDEVGHSLDEYIKKYPDTTENYILDTLKPNEVLIISVIPIGTMPTSAITWVDSNGETNIASVFDSSAGI